MLPFCYESLDLFWRMISLCYQKLISDILRNNSVLSFSLIIFFFQLICVTMRNSNLKLVQKKSEKKIWINVYNCIELNWKWKFVFFFLFHFSIVTFCCYLWNNDICWMSTCSLFSLWKWTDNAIGWNEIEYHFTSTLSFAVFFVCLRNEHLLRL